MPRQPDGPLAPSSAGKASAWIGPAVGVGVVYTLVGVLFALPTTHARAWRLAAWLICAGVYAAHIGYERLGLRNKARSAALHVALAVALGAFGLAFAGNMHSLAVGASGQHRRLMLIALAVWPVLTAFPAFVAALGAGAMLAAAAAGRADRSAPSTLEQK